MSARSQVARERGRLSRTRTCGVDLMVGIYERRSVRSYEPRPVPKETVRALLDAAVQAPSAVNLQPWAFVVVQHEGLLQRISARSKALTLDSLEPGDPLWDHRALLADPEHDVFHRAGTLIAVCATPSPWPASEDCCLAAQNLMLAAHGLGLGTCPIGLARRAMNEPAMREELDVPDDHAVVLPIVVGYPRELPEPPPRRDPRVLAWR